MLKELEYNNEIYAIDCYEPKTEKEAKVHDTLVDWFQYDFDFDWFERMNSRNTDGVISMLLDSWCEDQFFFVAKLTLRDLYEYLHEKYLNDEIEEETYHFRLATLTDTWFYMGYDK